MCMGYDHTNILDCLLFRRLVEYRIITALSALLCLLLRTSTCILVSRHAKPLYLEHPSLFSHLILCSLTYSIFSLSVFWIDDICSHAHLLFTTHPGCLQSPHLRLIANMTAPFTPDSAVPSTSNPNRGISVTALSRFEFEAGKANDGTKILMIEWEDDSLTRPPGSWHVSWEGKKAVLPADEKTSESTRRFYFLLPPNMTIPPVVTLEYKPFASGETTEETEKKPNTIQLNPLPAIFPPELGVTGRSAGKKGVLHTIWAKKRLQVLEKEIREECLNNAEGIALHMALQEKEWIETHFGVGLNSESNNDANGGHGRHYPMGPTTPVSPSGSGKLGEKLKGLKLQTSEQGLSPREGMSLH